MSIAARHIQSPRSEERNVVLSHTPESVGVGCPNPSDKATSPLRWIPHRKLSRLSLQRSDMSIAASNPRAPEERNVVLWHTPNP